eukprot:2757012-Rhodomonas_salina.3
MPQAALCSKVDRICEGDALHSNDVLLLATLYRVSEASAHSDQLAHSHEEEKGEQKRRGLQGVGEYEGVQGLAKGGRGDKLRQEVPVHAGKMLFTCDTSSGYTCLKNSARPATTVAISHLLVTSGCAEGPGDRGGQRGARVEVW